MIKSSDQEKSKPEGEGRRPGRRRRNDAGDRTRSQIVDAALRTLLAEGYSGTSARAVATTGGFSAALIFYHFGSLDAVLLAVMDRVSDERLSRYRSRLHEVSSLSALAAAMAELYAEDLSLGHLTAVQEIVAGMAFDDRLGAEILARMQPWFDFATELAGGILAGTPLDGAVDPATIGSSVIALYLGQEIVDRMRRGEAGGSSALVATLTSAAPWLDRLLGRTPRGGGRRPPERIGVD
ncbi:MAG TPA: TetR/AcrR family transcriptional regulator [Candidatus Dormibacteraeota bacterium]|jgi:AcrR family transcriptional regulator